MLIITTAISRKIERKKKKDNYIKKIEEFLSSKILWELRVKHAHREKKMFC